MIPIETDPAGQRAEIVKLARQLMRRPHPDSHHGHGPVDRQRIFGSQALQRRPHGGALALWVIRLFGHHGQPNLPAPARRKGPAVLTIKAVGARGPDLQRVDQAPFCGAGEPLLDADIDAFGLFLALIIDANRPPGQPRTILTPAVSAAVVRTTGVSIDASVSVMLPASSRGIGRVKPTPIASSSTCRG